MKAREGIGLVTSVMSDVLFDLMLIFGLAPIYGDILDGVQMAINYWAYDTNLYMVAGLGELIPLMDVLPLHTGVSIASMARARGYFPEVVEQSISRMEAVAMEAVAWS